MDKGELQRAEEIEGPEHQGMLPCETAAGGDEERARAELLWCSGAAVMVEHRTLLLQGRRASVWWWLRRLQEVIRMLPGTFAIWSVMRSSQRS